jgi:hypothetical protein
MNAKSELDTLKWYTGGDTIMSTQLRKDENQEIRLFDKRLPHKNMVYRPTNTICNLSVNFK